MDSLIDERELAGVLSVSRRALRDVRNGLEAGVHWERGHGGSIEYTVAGVAAVKAALAEAQNAPQNDFEDVDGTETAPEHQTSEIDPPAQATDAIRPIVPMAESAPLKARVIRKYRNPRIVTARLGGLEVLVRVGDSANIVVGMEMPVVADGDAYRLARKAPRWKGKW